jgi:hypothetical protein
MQSSQCVHHASTIQSIHAMRARASTADGRSGSQAFVFHSVFRVSVPPARPRRCIKLSSCGTVAIAVLDKVGARQSPLLIRERLRRSLSSWMARRTKASSVRMRMSSLVCRWTWRTRARPPIRRHDAQQAPSVARVVDQNRADTSWRSSSFHSCRLVRRSHMFKSKCGQHATNVGEEGGFASNNQRGSRRISTSPGTIARSTLEWMCIVAGFPRNGHNMT